VRRAAANSTELNANSHKNDIHSVEDSDSRHVEKFINLGMKIDEMEGVSVTTVAKCLTSGLRQVHLSARQLSNVI